MSMIAPDSAMPRRLRRDAGGAPNAARERHDACALPPMRSAAVILLLSIIERRAARSLTYITADIYTERAVRLFIVTQIILIPHYGKRRQWPTRETYYV